MTASTKTAAVEPVHYESKNKEYKIEIVWRNVIQFLVLHLAMVYGIYLSFVSASWKTILFAVVWKQLGFLGITAGAHRLWAHRSYKAKWPLRLFLSLLNCIAFQNDIYIWCRDHRMHHKYTDTNADPHSIKRGFFFAHLGWVMCKKHPDVIEKGKSIYMDDIAADPVIKFHRRFYKPLVVLFSFYLPTMIPVWCWGETTWTAFYVAGMARYGISLNVVSLVNSAAHYYGYQPFDKHIEARENPFVAVLTCGEGWHNYHHVYPWDYSTSELGYTLNWTTLFIDVMAKIGLAYDLKTANPKSVQERKLKTGDGTRIYHNGNPKYN